MHRKMLALIFIFFGISFFSLAQESEWYLEKTIAKIEFSGLKNLKKSDLNGIISSYIGQPFSDDLFNDILDRLYALDYFDEINPYAKHNSEKNDDVLLVFEVIERPVIKSVTFTGNKKIRNGELREQIKIKASDVYVESKVLLDERIIRNYYLKKGYTYLWRRLSPCFSLPIVPGCGRGAVFASCLPERDGWQIGRQPTSTRRCRNRLRESIRSRDRFGQRRIAGILQ